MTSLRDRMYDEYDSLNDLYNALVRERDALAHELYWFHEAYPEGVQAYQVSVRMEAA